MRAIVILVTFIFLTAAGAVLLISLPQHGPVWALALLLPMIWLAHTWAAAISPLTIAGETGAHSPGSSEMGAAQLSPARLALNAYAMAQFALLGALWLALPSYWLLRGGGMPAALGCAAAATAWLVLYRRRWAYPMWIYFQAAQARRLNILARELESRFWQAPEGSVRAGQMFWQRGIWVNILDATLLLMPLLLLFSNAFTAQVLRNWLSFCLLLLPSLSLLRVQLSALAVAPVVESEFVLPLQRTDSARNVQYQGLSGAFDSLEPDVEPSEVAQTLESAFEIQPAVERQKPASTTNTQAEPDLSELHFSALGPDLDAPVKPRIEPTAEPQLAQPIAIERRRPEVAVEPEFSNDLLLQRAVIRGDVTAVNNLLKRGANANAVPLASAPDQRTPLVIACASGGLAIIKLLIEGGADVNGKNGDITPLLAATRDTWSGRFDVVTTLLTNGADVTALDNQQVSALHGAARSTDAALMQLLLEAGANINQVDVENYSALARAVQSGQTDNVLALLKAGAAYDVEGTVSLARALSLCREPDAQLIECVVSRTKSDARDAQGNSPLHFCGMEDAAKFAEELILAGANVNAKNQAQQTPTMLAARAGSVRTLHRLCLAKIAPALVDADGNTALHHAVLAELPKLEIIETLLQLGCPAHRTNTSGATAADIALKAARWDLARRLSPAQELSNELEDELEHSNENTSLSAFETGPKREQLLIQAAQAGRFTAAQALLKLGPVDQHTHLQVLLALGDKLDAEGLAELTAGGLQLGKLEQESKLCALARQVPPPFVAIQCLLDAGAAIATDGEFASPLILLCGAAAELEGANAPMAQSPSATLINAMIAAGVDIAARDGEQRGALSYAVQWCDVATVAFLLEVGAGKDLALNTTDSAGLTPLLRALARPEAAELVRLLIVAGADPNVVGRDGRSARAIALGMNKIALAEQLVWPTGMHPGRALQANDLVLAAARNDQKSVLRLVQLGFAIDATDSAGATALTYACAAGNGELIEFLLKNGASAAGASMPANSTIQALTPLAAAVRGRHFDVIRRLVALGAPINAPMAELSCLSLAAGMLDLDCVTLLIELGASTTPEYPLLPPVHAVLLALLAGGDLVSGQRLLQVLIQRGADPDAVDSSGRAPLMLLLSSNMNTVRYPEDERLLTLIEALLRLGANAQVRDQHQRGALHWCCKHALFQCAELLLNAGADPLAVDEFRKLPSDMATTLNRHDFLALFRG